METKVIKAPDDNELEVIEAAVRQGCAVWLCLGEVAHVVLPAGQGYCEEHKWLASRPEGRA